MNEDLLMLFSHGSMGLTKLLDALFAFSYVYFWYLLYFTVMRLVINNVR